MLRLFLVLLALTSAGCAGVSEMRTDGPFATFASGKSPDAVADCVAEAWTLQERFPLTPDVRINPIANGRQVMIYNPQSMAPDAFADVTRDGAGSLITYYSKHRQGFKQAFSDLIQPCL
ncbi:hypothetical protein [Luteimonas sp. MHLX1A]|uniref:hypothetical protein n=1 Tax=Alterluteimonas muca TaxID=2878684 RepID=UPI001E4FEFF0|nr:hypothetical protein [Luteimonas sp. MHLX1A]MCD9046798.1 hypothetical protein [Luteimonas sp. MHLX1A]